MVTRVTHSVSGLPPHVGAVWGLLAHCGLLPDFPQNPTCCAVIPKTKCWLQCGQFLTRHFDAFLEHPVAHHLALDLVHTVDHCGMVPPAERLPDLHQLHP